MRMMKRLQKLASSSAALRNVCLRKEAGLGRAAAGAAKYVADKTLGFAGKQIKKHGPLWGTLGLVGGGMTLAETPKAVRSTYRAYKSGFNPALHKAELGLD